MGGHFFLVVTSVFTPEHQPAFNYEVNINWFCMANNEMASFSYKNFDPPILNRILPYTFNCQILITQVLLW
jgi:hypothetical protein